MKDAAADNAPVTQVCEIFVELLENVKQVCNYR
jgi:hypothetical protein